MVRRRRPSGESRRGEEGGGLPKAPVPQVCVCIALPTHRDVQEICLCPGCLCQDHRYLAAPCPGSSTCWSLSKGPSVTAGEWRVKVRLNSASVPPTLALRHEYWAVATWRGVLALCSVCSFPRAVWFLLIIPQRQTLLGKIEDGPAFPAPPGPGTLDCGMGNTQPDPGCWPSAWDCLQGVQKGSR